jgi:hypothetical protein
MELRHILAGLFFLITIIIYFVFYAIFSLSQKADDLMEIMEEENAQDDNRTTVAGHSEDQLKVESGSVSGKRESVTGKKRK